MAEIEKYNKLVEKEMWIKLDYWMIVEKFLEYSEKLKKINKEIEDLYEKKDFQLIQKKIKEKNKIEQFVSIYKTIKELIEEIELFKWMLEGWEIPAEEYKKEIEMNKEIIENQLNKLKELKLNLWYSWDCFLLIEWWEWGEESCLFAKELFESYKKYFEKVWIKYEINYVLKSDLWWYKNLKVKLYWVDDAYKLIYFEKWTHQVMRVPITEKKWRMHTSTVKVNIIPIFKDIKVKIDENKIIYEWPKKSWWKWWQNVNKRMTAFQIIYQLDNWEKLIIDSQEERYLERNKKRAYEILEEKLREIEEKKLQKKLEKELKSVKGDRAAKIRTYQFQNNLIYDVRVKWKKYNLEKIFDEWNYDIIHKDIISQLIND